MPPRHRRISRRVMHSYGRKSIKSPTSSPDVLNFHFNVQRSSPSLTTFFTFKDSLLCYQHYLSIIMPTAPPFCRVSGISHPAKSFRHNNCEFCGILLSEPNATLLGAHDDTSARGLSHNSPTGHQPTNFSTSSPSLFSSRPIANGQRSQAIQSFSPTSLRSSRIRAERRKPAQMAITIQVFSAIEVLDFIEDHQVIQRQITDIKSLDTRESLIDHV